MKKFKNREGENSNTERQRTTQLNLRIQKMKKMFLSEDKYWSKFKLKQNKNFRDLSILKKILRIADAPFDLLISITTLPTNELEINHYRYIFWPITGLPLFFIVLVNSKEINDYLDWKIILPFVLIFFLSFYFIFAFFKKKRFDHLIFLRITMIIGILGSISWIYLLIKSAVELVIAVSIFYNLDVTILSSLFIAAGSHISEISMILDLSKQGRASIACAGIYREQVFSLLFGYFIGLFCANYLYKDDNLLFFPYEGMQINFLPIVLLTASLLILFLTFIWIFISKNCLTGEFALSSFSIYVLVISIIVSMILFRIDSTSG